MKYSKMLAMIQKALNAGSDETIDFCLSSKTASQIELWSRMLEGRGPWINKEVASAGLPAAISGEIAKADYSGTEERDHRKHQGELSAGSLSEQGSEPAAAICRVWMREGRPDSEALCIPFWSGNPDGAGRRLLSDQFLRLRPDYGLRVPGAVPEGR